MIAEEIRGGGDNMEHIVEVDGIVTGFNITEQCIDCMCGKELIKIDKHSRNIILKKTVFEKKGLSRKMIVNDGQIFVYDFCTLYIFSQEDYTLVGKWQLGTDLSSDICGITVDEDTVYCSIRNGKIITLDRQSYSMEEFSISDSSMWSIKTYDKYLICGTVNGKLLLLDKLTLSIEKVLVLGKKNIGSLHIDSEILYAASHDGKIFKVNLINFEIDNMTKNAHKKMFDCVGLYKDMLITVSFPCSEIAFWNKDTLRKMKVLNTLLKLSGCVHIENDFMYISSRNILGIERISLIE